MYRILIRPIFFAFDPEKIHHFTFSIIRFLSKLPLIPVLFRKLYVVKHKKLQRTVFGLTFDNPVGLAAGFDKDAKLFNELSNFGFGFIFVPTKNGLMLRKILILRKIMILRKTMILRNIMI